MSRIPLMAGNWKMNLDHLEATHLVQKLDWTLRDGQARLRRGRGRRLPAVHRSAHRADPGGRRQAGGQVRRPGPVGARLGRLHRRDQRGKFLAKLGCTYVIVGHSERREYHHETDAVVADKLKAAYRYGLTPIFCCGEGLEIRKAARTLPMFWSRCAPAWRNSPRSR
jgi:triosephosphate isomerase